MILSNNPRTYIRVTMYYSEYGGILYKKYRYRWAGPSVLHAYNLRSNRCSILWTKNDIKKLRGIYDPK